jgi:hypothetical protein
MPPAPSGALISYGPNFVPGARLIGGRHYILRGSPAAYAWPRDGKKIAISRARYAETDVVMFSGFR